MKKDRRKAVFSYVPSASLAALRRIAFPGSHNFLLKICSLSARQPARDPVKHLPGVVCGFYNESPGSLPAAIGSEVGSSAQLRENLAQHIDRAERLVAQDVIFTRPITPCSVRSCALLPDERIFHPRFTL